MAQRKPSPGVSRNNRLSDQGLERLEKQLNSGVKVSAVVLAQWIKRYGEPARALIRKYGLYSDAMENDI